MERGAPASYSGILPAMRLVRALGFVMFCVFAACVFGIAHDNVTARVCLEYFTKHHPQILTVGEDNPTIMAFAWGIVATWWVGMAAGVILVGFNELGTSPRISYMRLAGWLTKSLIVIYACSMIVLSATYFSSNSTPAGEMYMPEDEHRLNAVATTHAASYLFSVAGIVFLSSKIVRERKKSLTEPS